MLSTRLSSRGACRRGFIPTSSVQIMKPCVSSFTPYNFCDTIVTPCECDNAATMCVPSRDRIMVQLKKTTLSFKVMLKFSPMRAGMQRSSGTHQQQNHICNFASRVKCDVLRKRLKPIHRDCASFVYPLFFIFAVLALIGSSTACSILNVPLASHSFSSSVANAGSILLNSAGAWRSTGVALVYPSEWVIVDLGDIFAVCGIATQAGKFRA